MIFHFYAEVAAYFMWRKLRPKSQESMIRSPKLRGDPSILFSGQDIFYLRPTESVPKLIFECKLAKSVACGEHLTK
jgi:hypothetical protein